MCDRLKMRIFRKTTFVFFVFCFVSVRSKDCTLVDQCSCKFDDGGIVDITSLGNTDNTPRFKDVLAQSEGNYYSFNPCVGFTEDSCSEAAACILSPDKQQAIQIGDAAKAAFKYDESSGAVIAAYTSGTLSNLRLTEVLLFCDEDACEPEFTADGQQTSFFQMTMKTVCACPGGCSASGPTNCSKKSGGMTVGAVLCIVFFVVVLMYFVGGTVFLKFVKKKEGVEVVPNILFWKTLPIRIKDGVFFTLGLCIPKFKKKGAYDEI